MQAPQGTLAIVSPVQTGSYMPVSPEKTRAELTFMLEPCLLHATLN